MALSHCHKPVLLYKWPLLQVCYKPLKYVAKHAHHAFFDKDQSLKVWWKKITTDKVIQRFLKVTTPIEYKKYMVSINHSVPNAMKSQTWDFLSRYTTKLSYLIIDIDHF